MRRACARRPVCVHRFQAKVKQSSKLSVFAFECHVTDKTKGNQHLTDKTKMVVKSQLLQAGAYGGKDIQRHNINLLFSCVHLRRSTNKHATPRSQAEAGGSRADPAGAAAALSPPGCRALASRTPEWPRPWQRHRPRPTCCHRSPYTKWSDGEALRICLCTMPCQPLPALRPNGTAVISLSSPLQVRLGHAG